MLNFGGSIAASAALGVISQQDISQTPVAGMLCLFEASTTVALTNLSVNFRTEQGQEVLVPEMPVYPLVERADYFGGVGFGEQYAEASVTATALADPKVIPQICAFIELGQLNMSGNDELSCVFRVNSAYGAGDGMSWWFVNLGLRPESILRVVEKKTGNTTFVQPEEVWAYRISGDTNDKQMSALTPGQLTITLRAGGDNFTFDARGAWALTRALGRIEQNGTRRSALLYSDKTVSNPSGDVTVNMSGTDSANYSIFAIERVLIDGRGQQKGVELLKKLAARTSELETKDPEAFRNLAVVGKVQPSRTLYLKANSLESIS